MSENPRTTAELIVECLENEGVTHVFGIPGEENIRLIEALSKSSIEYVLTRHEQGASFMAEVYGRLTGKAGVCLVTSGPGMTNVITALADAYMDSVPLVCFSGQVPTSLIGNDAFQEADTTGITRQCTKQNYLVRDVTKLSPVIHEAFHVRNPGVLARS